MNLTNLNPQFEEILFEDVETITTNTLLPRVILFNDQSHNFHDVVKQIIKAIECDFDTANDIAEEAHTEGKAVVFEGEMVECLGVSAILEEIELHTQIEC
ncbi:MAG: ATP-dependent Clp protease adaptor ClpS [Ignavibacteria bacterium]|jgi:ATP-dependent Clp protease adapter protein ClpS|nr:ATP-dependent Clp protease adaptor ClpS [Ignavibacteria bacterium]